MSEAAGGRRDRPLGPGEHSAPSSRSAAPGVGGMERVSKYDTSWEKRMRQV